MENIELISKQSMRSKYLSRRDSLTKEERAEKSFKICESVKEIKEFKEAEVLLIYMDYRSEVITVNLIEEMLQSGNKRVFCPKVTGMEMKFYEIHKTENLIEGYQGIREPREKPGDCFNAVIYRNCKCFMIMPGAAFDRERNRLGYGKGFFDKFLTKYPGIKTAALSFECQIARKLPAEKHDIKPDRIITEKGIID